MHRWTRSCAFRAAVVISLSCLVACGGGNMAGGPPAPAPAPALKLAMNATLGNYLVDGNRLTLYYFAHDLPGNATAPAVSNCTGPASDPSSCVAFWPIFHATNGVVQGIKATDVGEITRADGIKQTTYKGFPLYYFKGDTAAGDVTGDASTGGGPTPVWFVLREPAYTMLTLTTAAEATRLTDGSGRSLYYFAQDTVGAPPTSACDGVPGDRTTCVGNWPIFLSTTTVVPTGIDPARFTVFTRADNTQQSAVDGHPLYYFADDSAPGDLKGLTFGPGLGFWFTVDPHQQ
jgi:predicted lipoprotein with Yx(FWY)xxD motif